LGLVISLLAGASVLGVWVGIIMLLFPAFLVPFALRWYWARFNGAGFALGIAVGFVAAVVCHVRPPAGWNEAQQFLAIAGVSLVASLVGTLLSAPVPAAVLRKFYTQIGPFGWWPREWRQPYAREHRRDILRTVVALAWQVLTFLIPMGLVLGLWSGVGAMALLWTGLFIFLLREVHHADNPAPASSVQTLSNP
jgi:SSS family solute:Na+ symporter